MKFGVEFPINSFSIPFSIRGSDNPFCAVDLYQIKIGDNILSLHVFEETVKIGLEILLEREEGHQGLE